MLGHQRAQLADQVGGAPGGQLRRQAFLDRLQPQLLEARDLALGELLDAVVGQRRAAPQRERRLQLPGGTRRVGAFETRALELRLEAAAVDRVAFDLQRVARGPPAHRHVLADPGAQARDLLLQRLLAAVGGVVAPHRLDQLVDRDGLRRLQRERHEQAPLLGAFELDAAVTDDDLEWSQQPDLDSRVHVPFRPYFPMFAPSTFVHPRVVAPRIARTAAASTIVSRIMRAAWRELARGVEFIGR